MKRSIRKSVLVLLVLCLMCPCVVAHSIGGLLIIKDWGFIKVSNLFSSESTLTINMKFSNSESSAREFSTTCKVEAWQNGIELDQKYSGSVNTSKRIKDGASLDVTLEYELIDQYSLVEVDIGELFSYNASPSVVYFNPENQKWGDKETVKTKKTTVSFDDRIQVDLPGSWRELNGTWVSNEIDNAYVMFAGADAEGYTAEELEEDRETIAEQIRLAAFGVGYELVDTHEVSYGDDVKTVIDIVREESTGNIYHMAFVWDDAYVYVVLCLTPEKSSDQIDMDSIAMTVKYMGK